jgi:hypothetical protein
VRAVSFSAFSNHNFHPRTRSTALSKGAELLQPTLGSRAASGARPPELKLNPLIQRRLRRRGPLVLSRRLLPGRVLVRNAEGVPSGLIPAAVHLCDLAALDEIELVFSDFPHWPSAFLRFGSFHNKHSSAVKVWPANVANHSKFIYLIPRSATMEGSAATHNKDNGSNSSRAIKNDIKRG